MAHTVREMDEQELDAGAMRKIAKLALMEMTSSKVLFMCRKELDFVISECFLSIFTQENKIHIKNAFVMISMNA